MEDSLKPRKIRYFEWLAEICILMGKPISHGAEMVQDPNWFACFDDGMSPQDAYNEYIKFIASQN